MPYSNAKETFIKIEQAGTGSENVLLSDLARGLLELTNAIEGDMKSIIHTQYNLEYGIRNLQSKR